jgi:biotin carboxyl carrier protein
MKLNAEIAGQIHELNIRRAGATVSAKVDGRHYQLELRELGDGEYLFMEGTRVHDCRVARRGNRGEIFEVTIGSRSFEVKLIDPKRLRGEPDSVAHQHGAAEVVAPMPGRVARVLVEVGAHVEAGAGVIVVEAMKMQNELKAPRAGTVVALNAEPGATVNAGDVLAVVE